MWGGWYDDPLYMSLFNKMQDICKDGMDTPDVDVAMFVDEKSVCAVPTSDALIKSAVRSLGLVGTPYDAYLMSDFEDVFANYKACSFIEPAETPLSLSCVDKAMAASMPVLRIQGKAPTAAELREWLESQGVDMPARGNAVVYRGENYISVYTGEDGELDFCDRGEKSFTDVFDGTKVTFPTTLPKGKLVFISRKFL